MEPMVARLAALLLGLVACCSHAGAAENLVVQWNSAALEAVRESRIGPPMVARANAIVHTAMFDAWAAYDPIAVGTRLGGTLRRPQSEATDANKAQAMSYAAYRALSDLFPAQKPRFDDLMQRLGYDPDDTSTDPITPAGVGNAAAVAVIEFRHNDGANQLGGYADTTGYVPLNTPYMINYPDHWQPLSVADGQGGSVEQRYIAPHWGKVVPFALTSASQFRPVNPVAYPSREFTHQADAILRYSANLTDKEKVIAEYWADGPSSELPPGHWCLFAQYVSRRDNHTLDDDAKMFFALTNALLDASIVAWEAKRFYDSVRPVTAIHYLYAGTMVRAWRGPGLGAGLVRGEDWQPYQPTTVVTPPFPEYPSGHSTFSAAGAEILRSFTGKDRFGASYTQPAGTSRVEPGLAPQRDITLKWETFSQAADEAGISRRYGGIHFLNGDLDGRAAGQAVGAQAWQKARSYFDGTAR